MRRWLFLLLLVFGIPLDSAAQIIPHFAVFGGYTYGHDEFDGNTFGSPSNVGFSLNGWEGALEVKPIPLVGLVADVSRHYGSGYGFYHRNETSFLAGPQLSIPGLKRVIPFGHVLAGYVHGTERLIPLGPDCIAGCPVGTITGDAFAIALGGGVDIKLKGPIWVRAVQLDWLHANLNPDHHTQMRLATGIVFRFGR
jgi:hypothetical protein